MPFFWSYVITSGKCNSQIWVFLIRLTRCVWLFLFHFIPRLIIIQDCTSGSEWRNIFFIFTVFFGIIIISIIFWLAYFVAIFWFTLLIIYLFVILSTSLNLPSRFWIIALLHWANIWLTYWALTRTIIPIKTRLNTINIFFFFFPLYFSFLISCLITCILYWPPVHSGPFFL